MDMDLTADELKLIETLRTKNPAQNAPDLEPPTFGDMIADKVTGVAGSWKFIIIQSILLICWIIANVMAWVNHWDPYPFILLNLALSFQAAYTAPIILMSQNREAQQDRKKLEYFYYVNLKSELEIELLHSKIDDVIEILNRKQQA